MSGKTKAELQVELLKLKAKCDELNQQCAGFQDLHESASARANDLAAKCAQNELYIKHVEARNEELDMKVRVLQAEKFETERAKNAYAEQATMWQRKFHNKTVWDCFCQWFNRINTK